MSSIQKLLFCIQIEVHSTERRWELSSRQKPLDKICLSLDRFRTIFEWKNSDYCIAERASQYLQNVLNRFKNLKILSVDFLEYKVFSGNEFQFKEFTLSTPNLSTSLQSFLLQSKFDQFLINSHCFPNLKSLEFDNPIFNSTPKYEIDWESFRSLESLNFTGCELESFIRSIGQSNTLTNHLKKLTIKDIADYIDQRIENVLGRFKKLKYLKLDEASNWFKSTEKFPPLVETLVIDLDYVNEKRFEIEIWDLKHLRHLEVNAEDGFGTHRDKTFQDLPRLVTMKVTGLDFTLFLKNIPKLKDLRVEKCLNIQIHEDDFAGTGKKLEVLHIYSCLMDPENELNCFESFFDLKKFPKLKDFCFMSRTFFEVGELLEIVEDEVNLRMIRDHSGEEEGRVTVIDFENLISLESLNFNEIADEIGTLVLADPNEHRILNRIGKIKSCPSLKKLDIVWHENLILSDLRHEIEFFRVHFFSPTENFIQLEKQIRENNIRVNRMEVIIFSPEDEADRKEILISDGLCSQIRNLELTNVSSERIVVNGASRRKVETEKKKEDGLEKLSVFRNESTRIVNQESSVLDLRVLDVSCLKEISIFSPTNLQISNCNNLEKIVLGLVEGKVGDGVPEFVFLHVEVLDGEVEKIRVCGTEGHGDSLSLAEFMSLNHEQ